MTVTVDSQRINDTEPAGDDSHPAPTGASEPRPEPNPTPAPAAPQPAPAPAPAAPQRKTVSWTHNVARQTAKVSATLAPVAQRAGDRVAAASPMTLLLGLLGVLATLSIVASLAFDDSLGVTSAVLFVPALSAAIGAVGLRCLDERRKHHARQDDSREDATQLRNLEHTLTYVDIKLTAALTQFGSDRHNDAVIAMFQAKAATELYRGSEPAPQRNPALVESAAKADPASHFPLPDFNSPGELHQGVSRERAGLSVN